LLVWILKIVIMWSSSWRWGQHSPPMCWYPTTSLHVVTT